MRRSHQFFLARLAALGVLLTIASASASSAQRLGEPRLSTPKWSAHAESFRAFGTDPDAPRDLVLWAWRNETHERIASTRSDEHGRFDFGQIPAPLSGLLLGVSPKGSRPSIGSLLRIERALPAPALSAIPNDPARSILIHPVGLQGELRIRNATSGRLLARLPIASTRRGAMTIELAELLSPFPPEAILIHQVLEDGRQTPSAYYRLAPLD